MLTDRLLAGLKSGDQNKVHRSLVNLAAKTKTTDYVQDLFWKGGFQCMYGLLECEDHVTDRVLVLSILANCASLNERWRQAFYDASGVDVLVTILSESTDSNIISRTVRLLGNLSKNRDCLQRIQDPFILSSLVKHAGSEAEKCVVTCLRAIRIICCTTRSVKCVAEDVNFPKVLATLRSTSSNTVMLCLRMICELLKTQWIEICYRCIENETLTTLLSLSASSLEDVQEIVIEILFLLTLNSSCRVPVAMEGAINVFLRRVLLLTNQSESFKYATQGLCLCAREAVNRNRMKNDGVLPALVKILHEGSLVKYHESLVAAFVWFLFDDHSLGILIRANIIPALLLYLDQVTLVEYERSLSARRDLLPPEQDNVGAENDDRVVLEESFSTQQNDACSSFDLVGCYADDIRGHSMVNSSPETSPYDPNSPKYSLPAMSPHMSPNYSPPTSPESISSMDYDSYAESSIESTITANAPYQFQSADGIHAMIHGTRGPIHDILLLLSRFSQAKDPSSFFLFLPGFNSLLNYILLSFKPNPKCARILNRLTINSHCFDLFIRVKLVPRLYLRLSTGWSVEYLTSLLSYALSGKEKNPEINSVCVADSSTSNVRISIMKDDGKVDCDILDRVKFPSSATKSLCQLLISNIRSQSESSYGKGVLSHILLSSSQQLKETCVLSIPYIMWSIHTQKRILFDLKALDTLISLLSNVLTKDSETIVLCVEAIAAVGRLIGLTVEKFDVKNMARVVNLTDSESITPSRKGKHKSVKLENSGMLVSNYVNLRLPSGLEICCDVNKLANCSLVFKEMFSPDYIDTTRPFIQINDIDEQTFLSFLHILHGCVMDISIETKCTERECCLEKLQSGCPIVKKRKCLTPDHCEEMKSSKNSARTFHHGHFILEASTPGYFASNMLVCCDRFFVDVLKRQCEERLVNSLCSENVVQMFLLSLRYNSSIISRNSVLYLLTAVPFPMQRTQYFVELLSSSEKNNFVSQIQDILVSECSKKLR